MKTIQVLFADDHPIVRQGFENIIAQADDIEVRDYSDNGIDAWKKALTEQYDVIVLDISMPGMNGLQVLKKLRDENVRTPVLILSISPEKQYALRAIKSGASGYLTKNTIDEELIISIREVAAGKKYISASLASLLADYTSGEIVEHPHEGLSNREFSVMRLIAGGLSLKGIATQLELSLSSVRTYRARILKKMGMSTDAEITRYAVQHNLID